MLLIWFLVFPRLARWALYLAAWTGLLVTAVAAAPVTTVVVTGLVIAQWRGGRRCGCAAPPPGPCR